MDRQRRHWLEKFQVQLAAAAGLAAVYLLLAPLLSGRDSDDPIAFLATGGYGRLAGFAVVVWALAAAAGVITITGRPEGALAATLIGAGGMSLRSGQMRRLLWDYMDSAATLERQMIVEVLILTGVLIVAALIVGLVRSAVRRARPGWLWACPLAELSRAERRKLRLLPAVGPEASSGVLAAGPLRPVLMLPRLAGASAGSKRRAGREMLARLASFAGLAALIAVLLLVALMQSAQRGQIIFALMASFFVAVLVGYQLFPTPLASLSWLLPMIVAVGCYALAAAAGMGKPPQGWIQLGTYARALPIDWLSAGAGGAMLGYWVSARAIERKYFEKVTESKED